MPTKKIFQVLLLNGADVNSVDSGQRSALLSACWQGHLVIADILLTAGANVNHQCGQVWGSRVMYSEKAATLAFSLAKGTKLCYQILVFAGRQSPGRGSAGGPH